MARGEWQGKHFKNENEAKRYVGFRRLGFQALPELWTFQFVASALLAIVLGIARTATGALVNSLGVAITSANLSQLVATWQGLLIMFLWGLVLPTVVAIEVFAEVLVCNDVLYGRPVRIFKTLKRGLLALRRFLTPRGILVLLYVLVAAPLCGVGFSVSVTNGLYIPHFISEVIFSTPLYHVAYIGLMAVLVVVGLAHIFVIHAVLIDGLTPAEASRWSRETIRRHGPQVLGAMAPAFLFWALFIALMFVLAAVVPELLLEPKWSDVGGVEFSVLDLKDGATLTDAQAELLAYRIAASFVALFGSAINSLMVLLSNLYLMLRFTRCYDELAHEGRELWPARTLRHGYLRKIGNAIATLLLISSLSLGVGIFFDQLFNDEPVGVVGHRAAGTLAPENSLEGLAVAIEQGCYASEIDVQRTSDGYYVINHDDTFRRVAGDERAPKDMTLEEVRSLKLTDSTGAGKTLQVPTLEEMLDVIKGRERLLVELKGVTADRQMVDDVVAMVRARDCVEDVVLISLNYDVIKYAETTYPEFDTGLLIFVSVGDIASMPCDYLLMEEELATGSRISQVHAAGKSVGVWTVNTPEGIRKFLVSNTDLIITDRIDLTAQIQAELDERSDLEVIQDALRDVWT